MGPLRDIFKIYTVKKASVFTQCFKMIDVVFSDFESQTNSAVVTTSDQRHFESSLGGYK